MTGTVLSCYEFAIFVPSMRMRLGKKRLLARVWSGLFSFALFSPLEKSIASQSKRDCGDRQQLQCLGHRRLLSNKMPKYRKAIPTRRTETSVFQVAPVCSKITYRGADTITRVPASRRASPIISSVYFLSDRPEPSFGGADLYNRNAERERVLIDAFEALPFRYLILGRH